MVPKVGKFRGARRYRPRRRPFGSALRMLQLRSTRGSALWVEARPIATGGSAVDAPGAAVARVVRSCVRTDVLRSVVRSVIIAR